MTFKVELVDYEPDLFSDDGYVHSPDVLSVISDNENEAIGEDDEQEENSQETNYDSLISTNVYEQFESYEDNSFFNTFNNKVDFSDIEEKIEEEIEEEINDDETEIFGESEDEEGDYIEEDQHIEVVEIISDSPDEDLENTDRKKSTESHRIWNKISNKKYKRNNNKKVEQIKINCRLHCLEKPQLDIITHALTKLKTAAEPLKGPVLKIRQRTCCTSQQIQTKLPTYNGFISEYGLTKTQLERRIFRKEKAATKKKQKHIRVQEEKEQKDLYNEQIFCAWLKALRIRNRKQIPVREISPVVKRPKTANSYLFSPKRNYFPLRKRPSTSPSKGHTYNIKFE